MKSKDVCSLEEKLWLGRKAIKKQKHYFTDKVPYSQIFGFSVIMFGCESWTIKKSEHQRIDAFELCWTRLLRVPWTARRSNQSILKEINSEYSLEGLMLKLKLQYFGHLMWRTNSLEKTLMLPNFGGRRRIRQRMRSLVSITDSVDMNLSKLQEYGEGPGSLASMMMQSMESQRVRHNCYWTIT